MPKVGIARIRKTRELFRNPERFMRQLDAEVYKESLRGEIAVRLNTFSDVAWMGYKYHIDGDSIFDRNPKVQFYDYTRTPAIASRSREIANYHITISMHSLIEHHFFRWGVQRGFNFAVQFVNPEEYIGRELTIKGVTRMVVDGDKDDRRWLDPENVWVALRWKRNPKNKKGSDDCFESWGK